MENLTQTHETTPGTETPKPQAPRSAAQIAASRANGAKSKGPVTEEGKARAAHNSRRHGLLATIGVMETERSQAYLDLCADLYEEFEPLDEHERNLVDTMISAMWRRTRALGMETAGLSDIIRKQRVANTRNIQLGHEPARDANTLAFRALVANPAEQRVLDLLHRYEVRHSRTYDRALKSLLAYRKTYQTNPSPTPDPLPGSPETVETAPEIQPDEPIAASQPAVVTPTQHHKPQDNHPARSNFKKNLRKNKRRR